MNLLCAYQSLKKLAPLFFTKDAAMVLNTTPNHAAIILSKLQDQKVIIRLTRGRWAYSVDIDPLLLPNILAYPMQAYVSLYSALYYRGLIDQIPATVYAITNGKTKLFHTPVASVSMHSITPHLFFGYEMVDNNCLLMATPEKALFDTLYLMPAKSNQFKRLTEIDLPPHFDFSLLQCWIKKINNKSRQAMLKTQIKLFERFIL